MVSENQQSSSEEKGPPSAKPRTTPTDLVPTTDILYVVHQIGKLSASVDRLISDVATQDKKLDKLTHQASFIKGGLVVIGTVISAVGAILYHLLSAEWASLLDSIQPLLNK